MFDQERREPISDDKATSFRAWLATKKRRTDEAGRTIVRPDWPEQVVNEAGAPLNAKQTLMVKLLIEAAYCDGYTAGRLDAQDDQT